MARITGRKIARDLVDLHRGLGDHPRPEVAVLDILHDEVGPPPAVPKSKIVTMLGCETRAISSASRRNRRSSSSLSSPGLLERNLIATGRFNASCLARYTSPMPPSPISRVISYPGTSGGRPLKVDGHELIPWVGGGNRDLSPKFRSS